MASSFLSANDQTWYENAADTWFETFKKSIIVNKEPIKNIIQNTANQLLGYEENSNIVDYTYTPRNQTFDAVIKYNDNKENLEENSEIKLKFTDQNVEIYVKKDCADYINTDRTENIRFDDKTFNVYSTSIVKHYQRNTYYVFYLKETR
jgi:hypothetical protein